MHGSSAQRTSWAGPKGLASAPKGAYGDVIITVPSSLGGTYPPTVGRNISISVVPGQVAGSGTTPGPPPGLLTLANEGTGTGLVFDKVIGNVAYVRSLQAGTNIGIATVGENIVINATAPPVATEIWQYAADTNTLGSSVVLNPSYPGAVIPSDLVYPGTSTEASGTTLIFDASNGAFRAGSVNGAQWTQANRGANSAAFGLNNLALGPQTFVGGGSGCTVLDGAVGGFIGGGSVNQLGGVSAFIGAGTGNQTSARDSAICGGASNTASAAGAFVGAGGTLAGGNTAAGQDSFVGAGDGNQAVAACAAVLAGGDATGNVASNASSAVGGGNANTASGSSSFVGAGTGNTASGTNSFAGAGTGNSAAAQACSITGGNGNSVAAGATNACIAGGSSSTINAAGVDSFAAGHQAVISATHANCFVWSDGGANATNTTNTNQVVMSAAGTGGQSFIFYSNAARTLGVQVAASGTAWGAVCDRNMKENLRELDSTDVLARVEKLPIYAYNYIGADPDIVNRGPVAQDWHALFPSKKDPLRIETTDLDGVQLAAIKGLASLVRDLQAEVGRLKAGVNAGR